MSVNIVHLTQGICNYQFIKKTEMREMFSGTLVLRGEKY